MSNQLCIPRATIQVTQVIAKNLIDELKCNSKIVYNIEKVRKLGIGKQKTKGENRKIINGRPKCKYN